MALKRSGEKMWRLPVDQEYQEMIKSGIADIVNSGGRWGGAVTAAMFLKEFVDETLDPSRHRRRRLDGREQELDRERSQRGGGESLVEFVRVRLRSKSLHRIRRLHCPSTPERG